MSSSDEMSPARASNLAYDASRALRTGALSDAFAARTGSFVGRGASTLTSTTSPRPPPKVTVDGPSRRVTCGRPRVRGSSSSEPRSSLSHLS